MAVFYIILGLLLVLWFLKRNRNIRKGKRIPGPNGLPFIGIGFQVTPEKFHLKLDDLAKQYGDIVQLKVFGTTIISLNSADLIRKALAENPYENATNGRTHTFWATGILDEARTIAFYPTAFDGIHSNLRGGISKAMHVNGDGTKKFGEINSQELRRLDRILLEKQGEDIDFMAVIRRSITNVFACLLSGEIMEDEDKDVDVFWQLDHSCDIMLNIATNAIMCLFPFVVKLPGYYKTIYDDAVNAKCRILNKYFHTVRETHQQGEIRGAVDSLLDKQATEMKAGGEIVWTDKTIQNNILETIAAGIVSTMSGITSTILLLIHHPTYQDQAYNELVRVIGKDRVPSLDDRPSCPFMEAIILESLRYIPPAPLFIPHLCSKDIELEGYHIPAGSLITPNSWHVNHNEAVLGDPWTFRPERWLDESGQLLPASHPLKKHMLPFGVGRRQCSGERFGRNRLFLYLASLLKSYKFTATPGKCGTFDPRYGEFILTLSLQSSPYFCKAERRA